MRDLPKFGGKIDQHWADCLYRGFLRKIENLSYEDARYELPKVLFDKYKQIYPERCPVPKTETTPAPLQPKLIEASKGKCTEKKSNQNPNQPSLF